MCIVCSHCIHTVYCDVYKVTKNNETFWQLLTLLPILLSSSWAPSPPSEAASSSAPKHLKGCWKLCMIMWQEQLPQCSSSSILSWRRSGKLWELCTNKFEQEIRETFTAFLKPLTVEALSIKRNVHSAFVFMIAFENLISIDLESCCFSNRGGGTMVVPWCWFIVFKQM